MNAHHQNILTLIRKHSGKPTRHTFLDNYLGNTHPRYPISNPVLRTVARTWMKAHHDLTPAAFKDLLTSLTHGKSATEKYMTGILLDYAPASHRKFDPEIFDDWLEHLVGWAEIDSVCSGKYSAKAIPENAKAWKKILTRFSKSKNIHKRRASLVLLVAPLRSTEHEDLAAIAVTNIERLKHEKEILITKAVSWLLRSMIKHHRKLVTDYVSDNRSTLPAIAVRETLTKIKTGRKNPGLKLSKKKQGSE